MLCSPSSMSETMFGMFLMKLGLIPVCLTYLHFMGHAWVHGSYWRGIAPQDQMKHVWNEGGADDNLW